MIPYPKIDPVFLRIGPLAFRWYGLMYALSFFSALFVIGREAQRKDLRLKKEELSDLILWAAIGVIAGGRLGYILFYNLGYYLENPSKIPAIWEGGMSFHGGLLGVLVAGWLFSRSRRRRFLPLGDAAVIAAPIGLGLGRIGNFINGELFGRPTDLPWCMVFPAGGELCRHPSQLYQTLLEGPLLFGILYLIGRKNFPAGVTLWSFFLFYGLFRFLVEFFREPDPQLGLVAGLLSMGQILSLPMFAVGLIMAWIAYRGRFAQGSRA